LRLDPRNKKWLGLAAPIALSGAAVTTTLILLRVGHPSARPASSSHPRAIDEPRKPQTPTRGLRAWAVAVDGACAYGHKMYPAIALGPDATSDDMQYAVSSLVHSVAGVAPPSPRDARVRTAGVLARGRAADRAWLAIAQRPDTETTLLERQRAERLARAYVNGLVRLGARQCARLRPASVGSTR
jgi:hypothetical protein